MMKCLQCGSENIVPDVRAVDRGADNMKRDLKLEVYDNPDAWIFKGAHEGTLRANVCADCGHVMFYVSRADAAKLKKFKR